MNELQQVVAFGRGPRRDYPLDQTLHSLFEQRVADSPDRIAISSLAGSGQRRRLTYEQLNRQANRLANWLLERGVEPGAHVALLLNRGSDYLTAMLAVLKCGASFIPVDRDYPAARQRHMLEDGEAQALITNGMEQLLPTTPQLSLDLPESVAGVAGRDQLKKQPDGNPSLPGSGRDHAYTLYTSGSTGLPKGARVRHDGAINHIYAEFDALDFHGDSTFLQSAPLSSDISVWQYLGPLLIGGRVVVVDQETLLDAARLHVALREERVTIIELVPTLLANLLDYCRQLAPAERELPSLEWAMVTGEAVAVALVNRWLALFPAIPVVNAYGPTEAADDVCQSVIRQPLPEGTLRVPIGRPLANLQLFVVREEDGELAAIGEPGEILVAGVGVGSGYWRLPEQTERRFVANRWGGGGQYEERVYRTGDRGIWLADGELDFVGRLDDQLKLRGHRIEAGEVEARIAALAGVAAVVVDLAGSEGEEGRLVAWLTLDGAGEEQLPALRRQLHGHLPHWMVPEVWVLVERMPLQPNGKVDRRALPPPPAAKVAVWSGRRQPDGGWRGGLQWLEVG